MSELFTQEELGQYVDWTSLEYYDKRVKEYIDARCTEDLKIGGDKHSSWFSEAPDKANINKLYRVINEFETGATFEESGISCGAGSVIYLDNTRAGLRYKLLVNMPSLNTTLEDSVASIDASLADLTTRMTSVESTQVVLQHQADKADVESSTLKSRITKLEDDVEDAEERISEVVEDLRATEHSIHDQLHSHELRLNTLSSNFATKLEVHSAVSELETKINNLTHVDLEDYATNESVDKKISDAIDAVDQNKANKSDLASVATTGSYRDLTDTPVIPSTEGLATEEFVQEAIKSVVVPDLEDYAKKEDLPTKISELDNDSGYVTEQHLTGLATEQFVREQLANIPDVDVSNLATKEEVAAKADKDYVDTAMQEIGVDLANYATKDYVRDQIANAQLGDGDGEIIIDLEYLATKTELASTKSELLEVIESQKSNLLFSETGDAAIQLHVVDNKSVVDAVLEQEQTGIYTIYCESGCTDNPVATSVLRGLCHVAEVSPSSEAWILLLDESGTTYTKYIRAGVASAWNTSVTEEVVNQKFESLNSIQYGTF